jgi:phytoene/squalene synthetase
MRANHDAFDLRLRERKADWAVLAALFAADGLTDRYGNPPKPESARKAWLRVRTEIKAARATKPTPTRSVESPPPARAAQPPAAATTAAPTDHDDEPIIREPRHKFGGVPVTSRFKPKED